MERYRFASVQLDGGLQQVAAKVETQFRELHALLLKRIQAPARVPASMSELRIGIMADGQVDECLQRAVGLVVQAVCGKGGTMDVMDFFEACGRVASRLHPDLPVPEALARLSRRLAVQEQ